MSSESGTISLVGDVIRYEHPSGWELPLDRVRVIGEATTDQGPFVDDWFLCFAADASGWHEASAYAAECESFIEALSTRLGAQLTCSLYASADYDSRVLWPASMAGQPMFTYTPNVPENPILRWIAAVVGPSSNTQLFSETVDRYLRTPT